MDKWSTVFGKMLIERNNPNPAGIIIGKVINGLPNLVVSIGDEILLDMDDLIVPNYLFHKHTHSNDEYHTPITITINAGDQIILIPTPNQQKYAVLDKVGE
ncbi:DUF2577 family protein [Marinicrinis sediminis]|uniref:DUF2577 family protein n=1 Tax=Marinicrinis sediminis TaxID=1652465 RepID=A0ABW5R9Z2_9BACL